MGILRWVREQATTSRRISDAINEGDATDVGEATKRALGAYEEVRGVPIDDEEKDRVADTAKRINDRLNRR